MTKNKAITEKTKVDTEAEISLIMDKLFIDKDLPLEHYDLVSIISELNKVPRARVNQILASLNTICRHQLAEKGCFEVEGLVSFKLVQVNPRQGQVSVGDDGVIKRVRPLVANAAIKVASQLKKVSPKRI